MASATSDCWAVGVAGERALIVRGKCSGSFTQTLDLLEPGGILVPTGCHQGRQSIVKEIYKAGGIDAAGPAAIVKGQVFLTEAVVLVAQRFHLPEILKVERDRSEEPGQDEPHFLRVT